MLRRNTEKYITFTVPIEKEVTKIDKNGEEIVKNMSYILQFTDSARFKASSLLNVVNNIPRGVHEIKCKYGLNEKKCEICRIKHKYYDCFLEYRWLFNYDLIWFKDNLLIEYTCFFRNKNYQ